MDSVDRNVLKLFFQIQNDSAWQKDSDMIDHFVEFIYIFLKSIGQCTKHELNVGVGGREED